MRLDSVVDLETYPITDTEREENPKPSDSASEPPQHHDGYLVINADFSGFYENCRYFGRADDIASATPGARVARAKWVLRRYGLLPQLDR